MAEKIQRVDKGKKDSQNGEKIVLGILIVVLVLALGFSIYTFLAPGQESSKLAYTQSNYQAALNSENPDDICAVPAGYTEKDWKEHMSHHPDRYAKCLEK